MGILQNYTNNGSEYKSLKFGKDQPGGGSSKQPFMQKDINKAEPIQPGLMAFPSVLRGGIYSEVLAATDVVRLTKYFATPNGIQFAVNQNILSRLAPRTEASGVLNEYIYTPLSTLAQAGVGNLGIHLNKQGLDPTGLTDFAIKPYGEVVYENNLDDPNTTVSNRLVDLHFMHIENANTNDTNILTYAGGPGSIFGVGNTKIKFATKADGVTPLRVMGSNSENPKTYLVPGSDNKMSSFDSTFQNQIATLSKAQSGSIFEITKKYTNLESGSFNTVSGSWEIEGHNLIPYTASRNDWKTYLTPTSVSYFQSDTKLSIYYPSYKNDIADQTISSYTSQINSRLNEYEREIKDETRYNPGIQTLSAYASGSNIPLGTYDSNKSLQVDQEASKEPDPAKKWNKHKNGYLANLDKSAGYYVKSNGKVLYNTRLLGNNGVGPDFRTTDRDIRGFNDKTTQYYDYVTDSSDYWTTNPNTVDHIYYQTSKSGSKRESTPFGSSNDLISFQIGILDPTPPYSSSMHTFRAYIDNLSDSYDADWSPQTYMGRGEKLYKYNSFGRSISLGFTVVAEGANHLSEMYKQLNILASSLAPSYVGSEYMAGNIHQVSIGNYINKQYGIITGLTFDIDNESPWEINKDSQLPHFIKVTGFKFIPLHNFRPEYTLSQPHSFIAQNATINGGKQTYTPT